MNVHSNPSISARYGQHHPQRSSVSSGKIQDSVRDVFNSDFLKRMDRIESEIQSFGATGLRQVETPQGPLKLRKGGSLLKTSDGFVLKLLQERGLPVQHWAEGHRKKDGLVAKFDEQSNTISVKEVCVRPHREGFGERRRVETIGQVTTYNLNLAEQKVTDLTVAPFKGQEPEYLLADFK